MTSFNIPGNVDCEYALIFIPFFNLRKGYKKNLKKHITRDNLLIIGELSLLPNLLFANDKYRLHFMNQLQNIN